MNDLNNFNDRLLFGEVGEVLVKQWLSDTGYVLYPPITEGIHWIDFLVHDLNKQRFIGVEVKTKKKMRKYNATGINKTHLEDYQRLSKKHLMDIMLFFVDTAKGEIYFGDLSKLLKHSFYGGISFPNYTISQETVLFPLEEMTTIKTLQPNEIEEISRFKLN